MTNLGSVLPDDGVDSRGVDALLHCLDNSFVHVFIDVLRQVVERRDMEALNRMLRFLPREGIPGVHGSDLCYHTTLTLARGKWKEGLLYALSRSSVHSRISYFMMQDILEHIDLEFLTIVSVLGEDYSKLLALMSRRLRITGDMKKLDKILSILPSEHFDVLNDPELQKQLNEDLLVIYFSIEDSPEMLDRFFTDPAVSMHLTEEYREMMNPIPNSYDMPSSS